MLNIYIAEQLVIATNLANQQQPIHVNSGIVQAYIRDRCSLSFTVVPKEINYTDDK